MDGINKELIQQVIDRLLYCSDFELELKDLISKHNPKEKVKYNTNITEFNYPVDKN